MERNNDEVIAEMLLELDRLARRSEREIKRLDRAIIRQAKDDAKADAKYEAAKLELEAVRKRVAKEGVEMKKEHEVFKRRLRDFEMDLNRIRKS